MDTTDFYYAELNFSRLDHGEQLDGLDRTDTSEEDIIRNTLDNFIRTGALIYEESDNRWYFGQNTDTARGFIIGRFGKEFDESRGEYDESEGRFKNEEGANASQSWFVIDPSAGDNGLIAYNQGYRLRYKEFLKAFTQGYNAYISSGEQILKAGILFDERKLSAVLEEADRILRADFELEPTNPNATDEFEQLDERLKEMGVNELGLDAKSDDDINVEEELLKQARHMVEYEEKDYGQVELTYVRNDGETSKYESKNRPVKYSVKKDNTGSIDDLRDVSADIISEGKRFLEGE